MANDVKVVIELSKASSTLGFGMPLIFAGMHDAEVPYTECANLEEVLALFGEDTEVYEAAALIFMQDNAPAKIAVCGSTGKTVAALPNVKDKDWRQLIVASVDTTGESTIAEIAAYIEAQPDKMFFVSGDSADAATVAKMERTVFFHYESDEKVFAEAALVGATAGMNVGSFTYKNVILKGVEPMVMTDAELEAVHKLNALTIVTKAGDNVTSDGKTMSGEFIDIVDSKDYIIQQIEYQCQSLMNRVPKLHYDNRGIGSLEAVTVSVLKEAADNGMIAADDDGNYLYSVNFSPRSECADTDISARHYAEGKFEFTLAGAIHTARIKGTIIA